jgi:glycosyltransferase involved in cell wall biosynthesis
MRPGGIGSEASVSLLIPARNEAANIEACLETASLQSARVREILVYDDHSEDATASLVIAAASRDARIRLLPPQPLPDGWKGKPFACACLAEAATCDWLLFIDADARLKGDCASAMVRAAECHDATLMSFWPGIVLGSAAERWLMPLLNMVVFTLYPAPVALKSNMPSLGLAHGACMLFHAETYRRLGGHGIVRGELFEDTAMAREWRRLGERSLCFDGQDAVTVRMYRSLGELWRGFRKNFYPAFRTEVGFWLFLAFHAALFIVPYVRLAQEPGSDVHAATLIAACTPFAMRLVQCVRFRYPVWSAVLHPFAEVLLIVLGLWSWWGIHSGCGVEWKGRRYGIQ